MYSFCSSAHMHVISQVLFFRFLLAHILMFGHWNTALLLLQRPPHKTFKHLPLPLLKILLSFGNRKLSERKADGLCIQNPHSAKLPRSCQPWMRRHFSAKRKWIPLHIFQIESARQIKVVLCISEISTIKIYSLSQRTVAWIFPAKGCVFEILSVWKKTNTIT